QRELHWRAFDGLAVPFAEFLAAACAGQHATVRWLDAQPPGSVLYVALGSEVPLRVEQVHELALGLELAGTRFLWALRKASSAGAAVDTDILPPGFQERTRGQGLVTTAWVPQMSILAHAAVGGRRRWGCRWRGTRTTARSIAMASRWRSGPSWLRERPGVAS
uniref:Uncharacterized protein n=1 Tax=Aegilops tauschii subsp. strangulata TaxID=200361 RepID=A0A453M791_AEGTS